MVVDKKNLIRKCLALGIILLFVGVTIACVPGISAKLSDSSENNEASTNADFYWHRGIMLIAGSYKTKEYHLGYTSFNCEFFHVKGISYTWIPPPRWSFTFHHLSEYYTNTNLTIHGLYFGFARRGAIIVIAFHVLCGDENYQPEIR